MFGRTHMIGIGLAGALAVAACGTMVDASGAGTLNLQTATARQSAISASERRLDINGDVLVISNVELVAREIELEGDDGACDTSSGADSSGTDCSEVELGPVLLSLPLTAGAQQAVRAAVSAGTYNEIKFRIDAPDDDTEMDRAFRAAHPEFSDTSIRVTGTFNGVAFTFTSRINAAQEIDLPSPIVTGDASIDLTLFVDVDRWFVAADGSTLINPTLALAGEPMQATVENNIKASFQAFEDHDHDGSDDSHSGTGS